MSTEQPGKRALARAETMRRITEVGRTQLEQKGVEGLSLREVARELGMVSSAIYRYVASRDELLTLLLVQAFDELADAVDGDDLAAARRTPANRFVEVATRMRIWAIGHRAQWALLYGTPVPGYAAPAEQTTGPGTRVFGRFAEIAAAAQPTGGTKVSRRLSPVLDAAATELGVTADPAAMAVGATLWSSVTGAITAELFTQWGPDVDTVGEEFFALQLGVLANLL